MAFGKDTARSAAQAERKMDSTSMGSPAGEAPVAADRNEAAHPASTGQPGRAFGCPVAAQVAPAAPQASTRPPRPSASPSPSAVAPAADRPAARSFRPSPAVPAASAEPRARADRDPVPAAGGYIRQAREQSRRTDGLSLALERLIDEACDFMGFDAERRANEKNRATANPQEWERRLRAFYNEKIRPARAATAQTLEEGRRKNPGKVVFMVVEGTQASLKVLERDSEQGQEQGLLDGATVEVMSASRTPFPEPSKLFGRARQVQELDEAEVANAFSQEPGAGGARARRPA